MRTRASFQLACRRDDVSSPAIASLLAWVRDGFAALAPLPDAPGVITVGEP